jgi:hypothetical protein
MTRIDENQEAIACIRMDVNAYDAELKKQIEDSEDTEENLRKASAPKPQAHWKLGSPAKRTTSQEIQTMYKDDPAFKNFHKHLCSYLKELIPTEKIDGTPLKVCR